MKRKTMFSWKEIIQRLRAGESKRQIHRATKIHRTTIRLVYKVAQENGWLCKDASMPNEAEIIQFINEKDPSKGNPLQKYDEDFKRWLSQGMDATVMLRLLDGRLDCSISTLRRYLKEKFPRQQKPVMIRQTTPGNYMDVDFGEIGKFLDENHHLKKVWIFSARLRHSRKAYREIVLNQKASTFFACHINAFESFAGVPHHVVPDNLKAAVTRSTIDNEEINKSYQQLAEHYGFLIDPCPPFTPEHKGGVERDIQYVKRSFLPYFKEVYGKAGSLKIKDLKESLKIWERQVDDIHIIYGIGKTPLELFPEEKMHLKPLNPLRWQITSWQRCTVRRDWRIMADNAYYSVPYRLIGKIVDVCITDEWVRIFHEFQEVALHPKAKEQWEYKRNTDHAPQIQEEVLQCTRHAVLLQAEKIGPYTKEICLKILSNPKVEKLKPVRCLLRLSLKYGENRLESACKRALEYNNLKYESVKNILKEELDLETKEQKIIPIASSYRFARNLDEYKSDSKHGTAMLGMWTSRIADQILDEQNLSKEAYDE